MLKFKRVMFKVTSSVALVILFISLTNFKTFAQETTQPLKVRVGVYENPPKIYTDTDGNVKGFWPDLIDYIAKKENWTIEYIHGTFNEGLERLNNNEVDTMVDVAYSPDRAKIYGFTNETAFINWAGVYSTNNLEVNSFADLSGKRIAILDGDIHAEGPLGIKALMKSFNFTATYIPEPSYADTLKSVQEGKADIAIVNRIFGTSEEHNYNVKRTSIVFNPIELKFAFPKNGTYTKYFINVIDKDLVDLKADSESIYYKSIIKNLEGVIRTVEVTPAWIRPVIIASITIAAFGALLYLFSRSYQITLERRVKEKTKELLKSEVKFKEFADLLPQIVFETDENRKITYINNDCLDIFGYTKEEMLSGFDLEILFAPTKIGSSAEQVVPDLLNGKETNFEFSAIKKDKTEFPAYMFYSKIREENKVVGIRGIISDITKQKETEKQLTEKIGELEAAMRLMVNNEEQMTKIKDTMAKKSK